MTSLSDLEYAYQQYIASTSPISSSGQANDAFEVYSLSLIIKAAREQGANISFETINGASNPSRIIFRSSPGRIYSTHKNYCYLLITFPNSQVFEAHIGVFVEGLAGVIHECDVLILDASEGGFCRRNKVHPKKRNAVLTAECKFYSGNLGINLGREFLGLTVDIGNDDRYFLSNSDGGSLDRVLAHHKRKHYLGLTPLNQDAENQVVSLFRESFRNIIAKKR